MGLFNKNYNDSGVGIAKKTPQKKPLFKFFETFGNKFWVLIELNLIYVLFCLPIVTFGPATAALTHMMRNIYLQKPQFIFHDFLQAFKKNFKQSIVIGIFDIAAIALTIFSFYFYTENIDSNDTYWFMYALTMAAEVIFLLMNFYIYPQIVALNLKMPAILKNSLILAFLNIKGNLIALFFFIGYAILIILFGVYVLVFAPIVPLAWLALISIFCCYPMIQKLIINPFYEANGEKNPEIPDYENEEALFEDMGGSEAPIKLKKNNNEKKGKVIK